MSESVDPEAWAQFPLVRPAPRRVGYREGETATSLLVRLGLANGMRDIRHLLQSIPHVRSKQVANRESRIEIAARLSGFNASCIDVATPTRMTGSLMSVAGLNFNRRGTRPGRACPICVVQDMDVFASERADLRAFRRGWWQVPSISTCPVHGVAIVAVCNDCGQALDERRPLGTCRCGEGRLREIVVDSDACQHDAWILGRLGFAPLIEHPNLDAMPLDVASELCRILGCSAVDEKAGSYRHTDARILAETRSLGWRILLDGDTGLEKTLDAIVARNRSRGSVCNTGYGSLHRFLTINANPALDPVREHILAHARANVGLGGAGARLFGQTVANGERLSLVQGAKELAVAESFLANVLLALDPEFRVSAAGPTLLDRMQLLGAKQALLDTMRTTEMKAVLGIGREMMKLVIERKWLQCLIQPSPGHFGLVWRCDVERISSLFESVPKMSTDDLVAPAPFAKLGGVALRDILASVINGSLQPVGRRFDVNGFRGLLFDPAAAPSLWAVVHGKMPRRRLTEALGWMPSTIPALQRVGLLEAEDFEAVKMEALKSFRSRYASAEEAFAWLEKPPRGPGPMHTLLRNLCGTPIVSGKGITAFWPRSLLVAQLRPLMRVGANIHAIGFGSSDYPRNRCS